MTMEIETLARGTVCSKETLVTLAGIWRNAFAVSITVTIANGYLALGTSPALEAGALAFGTAYTVA